MIQYVPPDMAETKFWETGVWPLKGLDESPPVYQEQVAKNLDDVRKRLWIIWNWGAGFFDVLKMWGRQIGPVEDLNFVPYSPGLWIGLWEGFSPSPSNPTPLEPGELIVLYEWEPGKQDLFINANYGNDKTLDANPPVIGGSINPFWRLYHDPNLYCHADFNAGRPEIGAVGRWNIIEHPFSQYCGRFGYTFESELHRYYPQQMDPLAQVPPVKDSSGWHRRLDPKTQKLEIKAHHITQDPRTHWHRSRDVIGREPCVKSRRWSEYILEAPEPSDGKAAIGGRYYRWHLDISEKDFIEQFWYDQLMCEAYQDRVIATCEHQQYFCLPVTDSWILNFARFNSTTWYWGNMPPGNAPYYSYGSIVWIYNAAGRLDMEDFYVCIYPHWSISAATEPGTAGGEQYWMNPPWQPDYLSRHCDFADMQDRGKGTYQSGWPEPSYAEYWNCNGSTYELALMLTGSFDWWWDDRAKGGFPYIPIWLYDYMHLQPYRWPPAPRGCWRRTWRYSFGRIKNPDGTDALMWPGELGWPPGYLIWKDEPTIYYNMIVSHADYQLVKNDPVFWKYYRIEDVESQYAAAYAANKAEVDELLAKHHDPKVIQHREYEDPSTGLTEIKSFPLYEINHELVNDLRHVLLHLKYIDLPSTYSVVQHWWSYATEPNPSSFSSAGDAFRHFMAWSLVPENVNPTDPYVSVGYDLVKYSMGKLITIQWLDDWSYHCWQKGSAPCGTRYSYIIPKMTFRFTETFGANLTDIPPGKLMVRCQYNWSGGECSFVNEAQPCRVGFGDKYLEADENFPPLPVLGASDYVWAYMGMEHARREVVVDGGVVKRYTEFDAYLLNDWPEDSYFDGWDGSVVPWRIGWMTGMSIGLGFLELDKPQVFEIDYGGFPKSVFKQDETNFVEVT